ncbi:MAG TPA: hypothetical protein PLA50_19605 [Bacteroidia bacterium]|nr:hypothetical protein [Bacteroidia bacterium]
MIERDYRAGEGGFVSALAQEPVRESLADGKEKLILKVEPWLVRSMVQSSYGGSQSADPFAPDPVVTVQVTVLDVLMKGGITFGEGASLNYDDASWELTSVNLPEQNDLILSYFESMMVDYSQRLHIYAEIFEVSDSFAAGILESAAREADHTPERKAVLSAVKQGRGRHLESASLSARSGNRSRVAAGSGAVAENAEGDKKAEVASCPTHEEKEQAGLWLEVEPVLGADGMEIDLRLLMVHSQPAPEGESHSGLVSRTLESQASIIDGRWTLIASWSHGPGRVQLVFISASIQRLDYVQPAVKTDAEPDKPKE